MSAALRGHLNTITGRSKTTAAVAAAAAAAASAKHHGRTPTVPAARIFSSCVAGRVVDGGTKNNHNDATPIRTRVSTRFGCGGNGYLAKAATPAQTPTTTTPARHRDEGRIAAGAGSDARAPSSSTSSSAPTSGIAAGNTRRVADSTGGDWRRAPSSTAARASSPYSTATTPGPAAAAAAAAAVGTVPLAAKAASSPSLSLLAPAAATATAAYSSSSMLSPSAATYTGMTGGGGASMVDAVVVGAGQAGLSVAYHLQKAGGLRVVTLDANQEPGGAWRHRWPSLELFSTRKWSSLPGYPMFANGACEDGYPSTGEMAMYMEEYEAVMKLNVVRPIKVTGVSRTPMGTFLVETDCMLGGAVARWEARTVISAAGTHSSPAWPRLPGSGTFRGTQIHSSQYHSADDFRGKRVAVVGAGNSGAQILAQVSAPGVASSVMWSTARPPSFLPAALSGKDIFDMVARLRQKQGFVRKEDIPSLHSIIMQPGVIEAAERGVYDHRFPSFTRLTPTGVAWDASEDGTLPGGEADVDAIIWCTGYRSNTAHLSQLGLVRQDSTVCMDGREMGETEVPGVFAVGYGNWAGVGSGSIPGSTFYAKRAAAAALQHIFGGNSYDSMKVAVEAAGKLWSPASSSSMSALNAWPTAGRLSASAPIAAATLSGAPSPPAAVAYSGCRQEGERISAAA